MYAIGVYRKDTKFIWFLSDRMYDDLESNKKQADEWYAAMCTKEYNVFVIKSIPKLLQMTNDEHLMLYKDALYIL